jgi:hypothetical protein
MRRLCIFHLLSLIVMSGKRVIRLCQVQCFCQGLHFLIKRRGHVYSTNKITRLDLADTVKIGKYILYGMNSKDKIEMNVNWVI